MKRRKSKSKTAGGDTRYKVRAFKPLSVAEPPATYRTEPVTTRVFRSGNSQAVRLPRGFRLRTDEVFIFRRGQDIVLREKPLKLSDLLAGIPALPDDFPDEISDTPPEPTEDWS